MREQLFPRTPGDVFPWGVSTSRTQDLDHTAASRPPARGGPPGQTRAGNLGPLTRSHHRVTTFTTSTVRQPNPGTYLWRSPHGWHFLVTPAGIHPLAGTAFARVLWNLARRPTAEDLAA